MTLFVQTAIIVEFFGIAYQMTQGHLNSDLFQFDEYFEAKSFPKSY